MFELDNITDIRVNHNHRLAVRDRNGREYIPPTGIEDMLVSAEENDIFQYRTERVDSTVVRLENSMESTFTPNQSQLSIEDITYNNDDGELYVLVTGHIPIPSAIILKNIGGMTPAISQVSQVQSSSYVDGNTRLVIFEEYAQSGAWNGAGECYGYENSFTITTEKPHGLTGTTSLKLNSPPAHIGALVFGSTIQVIVVSNTTLQWITQVFPTTPLSPTQVNVSPRNIMQVSVPTDVLELLSNGVTFTGPPNTIFEGTHVVSYKDTEYFYVYFQKYQTGTFPQQISITIQSVLAYLPYVMTGETIEVKYKNGKTKRFKTTTEAFSETNVDKVSLYGRDTAYSDIIVLKDNIILYVEQGATVSEEVKSITDTDFIIDGNGNFTQSVRVSESNLAGRVSIKGNIFRNIYTFSSEDVYVDINKLYSNSVYTFGYNYDKPTYPGKALYFNFNEIVSAEITAMVISGNAYIKGGYVETSKYGHCLAIQGQDSKCYADIKHMKSIMTQTTALGVNAEVVTLEDVGDTTNYGQELYLDFDLIELVNEAGLYHCAAIKSILGKMYLKNGKIVSNCNYAAVDFQSFSGGRLRNLIIENSVGPALNISNYYGEGYLTPVEAVNVQMKSASDDCAVIIGGRTPTNDAYSNGKLVTSEIRNTSTNPDSCGVRIGNNVVSASLDSVIVVTGHASAKSVGRIINTISAVSLVDSPILTCNGHGIGVGQVVKLTDFDGDASAENGNSYSVTATTANTITLGSADFSGYTTPSTTGKIASIKALPIKRRTLVKVAPESVFTTITENTGGINTIASLT